MENTIVFTPSAAAVKNVVYTSGYKYRLRSISLEVLSESSVKKRYGRTSCASGASSTSGPGSQLALYRMSALLMSIADDGDCEHPEERAHVVYSAGDMPTTLEPRMKYSDKAT